jgi:dTDP-4-amino-4,6-dideoxygalactose transaminase
MSSSFGDRANAPNIVLLVSDGNTDIDVQNTVGNAISLRQGGAFVIAVSIGSDANTYVLRSIASEPTSQTIIPSVSYTNLLNVVNNVYNLTIFG